MRVALIGARRVGQGLGPFLARFIIEAGQELVAVAGTSEATAREASEALAAELGVRPDVAWSPAGLAAHALDAVVIASPHDTHAAWLSFALDRGLHVLCEKPLVWHTHEATAPAAGAHWAQAFLTRGLVLRVNAQWPWTLASFHDLHPDAPRVPARFFMQMPPRSAGVAMLVDSLSHPLSMLGRFDPDPGARIEELVFHEGGPTAQRWRLTFLYATASRRIEAEIVLDAAPDDTRATTYALDGRRAVRTVDPATYAMTLSDGDRRIPLPDPTPRLVRSFFEDVARGPPGGVDPAADPGLRHLVEIVGAARRHTRTHPS